MENTPSTEMFAFMYLYTANEISPSFVQSIVWFVRFDYLVHFPFPNGSTELYLFLLNRAVETARDLPTSAMEQRIVSVEESVAKLKKDIVSIQTNLRRSALVTR
jgi:hypothetical protein